LSERVKPTGFINEPFLFRRGLIESVALSAEQYLQIAEDLHEDSPGLTRLMLFDVSDHCADLAECEQLRAVRHLELFDWMGANESRILAWCPALDNLRTVTLCLGSRSDPEVCRAFAQSTSARLKEIRLLQVYGGMMAKDQATAVDEGSEECAALVA